MNEIFDGDIKSITYAETDVYTSELLKKKSC